MGDIRWFVKQGNTTMSEHKRRNTRNYKRSDCPTCGRQLEKVNKMKKFYFLPTRIFVFNPNAHLVRRLLSANIQAKRQGNSQKNKLPTLLDNRLISKVVFNSIKGNNLVTL